ncbi:adenylate/guanylate cyclase domain-containing protein [Stappia sp. GBMRC 2046]|uniref:Adenylate/guanylate cyclase domain-containing protein n=1 Tax=Stappia sediminis TaxID=2692190 RepID=A0A7X3LTR7_9HYPH|nr:adenylate/guanylate cyclase domain-containing protein [Stappia sediminis]MXN64931.1 adenylate/guanylate cyclase domain-containing protein [Stappia sediminis]
MERRLVAILAADVVGYTALMGADEAGTLERLTYLRHDFLEPLIDKHHGRIVKLMGDGLLVEFASVVDAVACAMIWQDGVAEREITTEEIKRLRFRIGINLGDVIVEGSDIHGEGVNVAARLEALAEPGGICMSGDAYRQMRGKVEATFEDLGECDLKNVAEPIQVYRIATPGSAAASATTEPSGPWPKPAIAVLPFANMSGDPEQEYFSDGITEDIITALSHWRSFPVIARNSSFSYKGLNVRVQKIAQELGARYLLEGSVRKAGPQVRITAQLIDAKSGHHVWAEHYDRQLEDIFEVQDEITNRIAAVIMPELEHFEHSRLRAKPTHDLSAWDYYLRGLDSFYDENCEGTVEAIAMFEAATKLDPTYCDAWARLGWCHARLIMFDCVEDRQASLARGLDAARKAVALDDSSALAHMSLGAVHIWTEETDLGLAEAQTALQLNPNFAHAAMAVGNRLDLVGCGAEGIQQMERGLALNPRDPVRWRYMAYLARAYANHGEPQIAVEWARKAVLLRPDLPEAQFRYAICLGHLDRTEDARAALERCNALEPGFVARKANWQPYADDERNQHLLSGLRRHGLLP